MLVYILTDEPYHENSSILGVYATEEAGLAALHASVYPEDRNCDDSRLTEWDVARNEKKRVWDLIGKDLPWSCRPLRKEFTLHGPAETTE